MADLGYYRPMARTKLTNHRRDGRGRPDGNGILSIHGDTDDRFPTNPCRLA